MLIIIPDFINRV